MLLKKYREWRDNKRLQKLRQGDIVYIITEDKERGEFTQYTYAKFQCQLEDKLLFVDEVGAPLFFDKNLKYVRIEDASI